MKDSLEGARPLSEGIAVSSAGLYANGVGSAVFDEVSSVRYCIPPGHRVRLYKDSNYSGSTKDLIGTGEVNLHDWGFGDKISSAQWLAF